MILILTQCFPPQTGGIENYVAGFAQAAAAAGRSVLVFADGGREARAFDRRSTERYRVRRFGGWKALRRRAKAAVARREARAGAVRLVLADSWKSLELLDAAPLKAMGAPILCLAHGMEFPTAPSEGKRRRIAAALAKADRVLANSRYTAGLAEAYAPAGVVEIATPPIPPQPSANAEVLRALSERIGPADPLIATLGRLEPRKGVDLTIAALGRLKERHPGARLAVAGDGADRERLEALANASGLSDRVAFLGRVDEAEKAALYELADVFAMPARRVGDSVEGFGIVYLEAGWHGAPAIAGADGGGADAVLDGETGLVCDGADVEAVTAALDRLLGDAAYRARLGEAAAAHARANLWSARIGEYLRGADG